MVLRKLFSLIRKDTSLYPSTSVNAAFFIVKFCSIILNFMRCRKSNSGWVEKIYLDKQTFAFGSLFSRFILQAKWHSLSEILIALSTGVFLYTRLYQFYREQQDSSFPCLVYFPKLLFAQKLSL